MVSLAVIHEQMHGLCTNQEPCVACAGDDECGARRALHCFEVHSRFNQVRGKTIHAHLQLAAIYAASASSLPDTISHMTGAEVSLELIAWCWTNQPLSPKERHSLANVLQVCNHTPALEIRCRDLQRRSEQLHFLHGQPAHGQPVWDERGRVVAEYAYEARQRFRNPRRLLTRIEEVSILGEATLESWPWSAVALDDQILVPMPTLPCADDYVEDVEKALEREAQLQGGAGSTLNSQARETRPHPFPLQGGAYTEGKLDALGKSIVEELRDSWMHCDGGIGVAHPPPDLQSGEQRAKWLASLQQEAIAYSKALEECLLHTLETCTFLDEFKAGSYYGAAYRMLFYSNLSPRASRADLARMACGLADVRAYNPFLSCEARKRFAAAVLLWLQLCVLNDKFDRMAFHVKNNNKPLLKLELATRRHWDVHEHPRWLLFEAEGGIQIRPVQYDVAKTMIDSPGTLIQLNMGQGKTRVIVPMLVLHWADGFQLVRVHTLTAILQEMREELHRVLTSSLLGCNVFVQPFHRDVNIDSAGLCAMHSALDYCRRSGGVLLVAPEHRLSLELKWHEFHARKLRTGHSNPHDPSLMHLSRTATSPNVHSLKVLTFESHVAVSWLNAPSWMHSQPSQSLICSMRVTRSCATSGSSSMHVASLWSFRTAQYAGSAFKQS